MTIAVIVAIVSAISLLSCLVRSRFASLPSVSWVCLESTGCGLQIGEIESEYLDPNTILVFPFKCSRLLAQTVLSS